MKIGSDSRQPDQVRHFIVKPKIMDETNTDKLSKKELKRLEKQQKEEGRKAKEGRDRAGSLITWLGAILIVIGGAVGAVYLAGGEGGDTPGDSTNTDTRATINENDWKKGSAEAKVTLLEYSDFQCPACGNYYPILKQLTQEFDGQVQFVYWHFPLLNIHKNAEKAGVATEAAGAQGKFWEMHDKLFENQDGWSSEDDPLEKFVEYAKEIGLDEGKFREDMNREDLKDKVSAQYEEGTRLGVNQTPTFFLDGEKISNPEGYDAFEDLINQKLNADQ